jgi:hypothetical protein
MKTRLLLGLLLPASLVATAAFADDKAACLDAAAKGQRFKDTHKLVEAREQLRVCAAAACPAVVQSDCANWLAEVEKALPTVVVTAKSGAGADLVDVTVTVDGQPIVSKLDGQAIPMNAGPHTFHFEGADGTLDQQVVVTEGEKSQKVAIVLGAPPPAPDTGGSSTWKTVGWVLGGVGVAGLGVGTVAGIIAMGDKNNAGCNSSNVCNQGTTGAIKSTALISDIGWIAGGVLLAGGAALVLFAPGGSHDATSGLRVAPVVTASGGAMVMGGSF